MIVWLASFPRSGNTFLRIVIHRMYGLRSSTVYDVDGVALRLGADFVGVEEREETIDATRRSDQIHLVKTHRPRDRDVAEADKAICLVRDGRDALVSWARQRCEDDARPYEDELRSLITLPAERGAGQWGHNVLSWLEPPACQRVIVRFEDLVHAPRDSVFAAMAQLLPALVPADDAVIPSFADLHAMDNRFFRIGARGAHRDELPDKLHAAFWAQSDNRAAMDRLGYHP